MMEAKKISRVDYMDSMLTDESVVFRKFIKLYAKNQGKVFFLLEGEDDIDYYLTKIEDYFGRYNESWLEMVCSGRSNVIDLIKDLSLHTKEEYRGSIHFGIIDKDYHEVLDNPFPEKIYITPCYSIENFYISENFMRKILKFKFSLDEFDDFNKDFSSCLSNYISRRNDFIDIILELDKYLRCNRIMYENKLIKSKINARDLKLSNFISIDLDKVEVKCTALEFLGKTTEDFDESSLEEAGEFYKNKSHELLALLIRGKFMFYFITYYLHKLKHDNHINNPRLFSDSYANSQKKGSERIRRKKTKLSFNLENPDLFSPLSAYADYPDCLKIFLNNKFEILKKVA
ncbi:DUF4435 domain-containing protein [Acinetobacter pittii]|uniref:DUF4435 domain-containing protein n=1 Tax=Acinetobacter pittii TaxID=48296 RepID=UPI003A88B51D